MWEYSRLSWGLLIRKIMSMGNSNEINVHTGGIGTSLEMYPDVTKAKEKNLKQRSR